MELSSLQPRLPDVHIWSYRRSLQLRKGWVLPDHPTTRPTPGAYERDGLAAVAVRDDEQAGHWWAGLFVVELSRGSQQPHARYAVGSYKMVTARIAGSVCSTVGVLIRDC